ncbi:RISC-loading complex subunit TARBP2-like isoform X2 [Danaus plexippus]|uniref:RISC-loading complex subunit TARBP2-like isoform X2 n=1 Tax=Danaus plexippus TaxID=13037 RepID=UPI002AB2AE3D|nr:RISC-loading complex subunit TARBP2-like isoform X2 [Danaus plexippus]
MMKTAVTVLQELMLKLGLVPEYECVSQSGPQHQAMFEYRCTVYGCDASGLARSKKEAKQEAARYMLQKLFARGLNVPAPYATMPCEQERPSSPPSPNNNPALEPGPSAATGRSTLPLDTRSYVALLKELSEQYHLGEPQYELVSDTGPAHHRHFSIRVSLGLHSRQCTSTTKKAARQLAAEQLYTYLRDNLSRLTGDFVEEEALARALEKSLKKKEAAAGSETPNKGCNMDTAMNRFAELHEMAGHCLDLGQRISEYHNDESKRLSGQEALNAKGSAVDTEQVLESVCSALGLRVEGGVSCGETLSVLRLVPTAPPLAFAGEDNKEAAAAALRYLRRNLVTRSV